jgi:hypothetical protein
LKIIYKLTIFTFKIYSKSVTNVEMKELQKHCFQNKKF